MHLGLNLLWLPPNLLRLNPLVRARAKSFDGVAVDIIVITSLNCRPGLIHKQINVYSSPECLLLRMSCHKGETS